MQFRKLSTIAILASTLSTAALSAEMVTVDNFPTAETNEIMRAYVDSGAFGKFTHIRTPTPLDEQNVIRMNLDTLYSIAVIDLTNPVTIIKPNSMGRFQSMLLINEDHSMLPAIHESGEFTFTQEQMGTRYMVAIIRTFADPNDPADVAAANALQDQMIVTQSEPGRFEIPDWDQGSLDKVRDAINVLALTRTDTRGFFGDKANLNPIYHLLGTASGWGGNPPEAALYEFGAPKDSTSEEFYTIDVKDVPVDGFWSITVYNADGFMEPNAMGINSYNNVTATANGDGGYTINFGGCDDGRINCIPVTKGWNYAVRLYQPQQVLLDGGWTFPVAVPAQ